MNQVPARAPGAMQDVPLRPPHRAAERDRARSDGEAIAGADVAALSAGSRAGLVLLPLGIVLGPYGLNVLPQAVIASLAPALPVALAVLGALAAIQLDIRRPDAGWSLLGWSIEGGLTMALVAAGVVATWRLAGQPGVDLWPLLLLLALCASASAPARSGSASGSSSLSVRLPHVDNVLAIALAGLALGSIREESIDAAVSMTAQTALVAAVIAIAVWVLVRESSSDGEQRVFAVGAFLMLGGVAEYLSLSALWAGLIAGIVWKIAGGAAYERLARDTASLQHPLVVVLLIVAGVRLQIRAEIAGLIAAYLISRTTGKLAGGAIVRRVSPAGPRTHVGARLIPPGVIGVGIAADTTLATSGSGAAETLLAVVVFGTLASDLLARFFPASEAE
jgi:hypothetical protein